MNKMKITNSNFEALASLMKEKINHSISKYGNCILGLPGGTSISGLLDALGKEDIAWSKVNIFQVDERMVPFNSIDSNVGIIRTAFLKKIAKHGKEWPNLCFFDQEVMDIKDYEKIWQSKGGRFDVALFSIGEDGHIASLFPSKKMIETTQHFHEIKDSPKDPPHRMSVSEELVKNVHFPIVLGMGQAKTEAVKGFLSNDTNLPVSLLYNHSHLIFATDLDL